ncbi:hypothetical protein INR49_019460 [Caranx melampygus]|nr:hypothetical protein INR49_019460 [Caranx melampygus]
MVGDSRAEIWEKPEREHISLATSAPRSGFIVKGPADFPPCGPHRGSSVSSPAGPVPVAFTTPHLTLSAAAAAPADRRAAALPPPPAPSDPPQAARNWDKNLERNRDRRPAPPPPSWHGRSNDDVTGTLTQAPPCSGRRREYATAGTQASNQRGELWSRKRQWRIRFKRGVHGLVRRNQHRQKV